jgi:hypothetical protein
MGCCGQSKEMPSLAKQGVNAMAAIGRVTASFINEKPVFAKEETVSARRAICLSCPECVPHPPNQNETHRCRKCGCWLDAKALSKLKLAPEACPINKWGAEL